MELWMKDKIFNLASILMRVPPLFVIDELFRISLGLSDESIISINEYLYKLAESNNDPIYILGNIAGIPFINADHVFLVYTMFSNPMYLVSMLKFLFYCLGCAAAICTFMLWIKHLIIVYIYLISVGVVFVSYWYNISTILAITTYLSSEEDRGSILGEMMSLKFSQLISNGPGILIIENYIIQSALAYLFCYIHLAPRHLLLQKILALSFTVPSYVGIYPFPVGLMPWITLISAVVPLGVCLFVIWYNSYKILKTLEVGYQHGYTFITHFGLTAFFETHWTRLHVPAVLRAFWILRVAEQTIQILRSDTGLDTFDYYSMLKTLMVNGCETLMAVLGMTSIISVICHYIGNFFHWVLLTDYEDEKSIGTVSAMLFYMLALQTGLTSLDKDNRLLRLCRNLCLVVAAVLHFVHNIVNPLLMSLSASHNPALHRHLRALSVCVFLIVFPFWLLTFLWSHYTISTWLLAVTVFSIEVVVKVFVSLAIYSLFLYDAYCKSYWDELDDLIYFIRSFGNTVEFTFGIILFLNGFWILVFEAGGTIRALLMCVHVYFNLWCEAVDGWTVFIKRREAAIKINSLLEASEQQLRDHEDVCAICYQEMEKAKITNCNHFFHGVCLRKWLYVRDRCPLCHNMIYNLNN